MLLEYRRDIKRFLRGERETYPTMPRGYFDADAADRLMGLQERSQTDRRDELIEDFPAAVGSANMTNTWRPAAASVYRSWLRYLLAQKDLT